MKSSTDELNEVSSIFLTDHTNKTLWIRTSHKLEKKNSQ